MSNKTSDKNVANIVTKEDLEILEGKLFYYQIGKENMVPQARRECEAIRRLLLEREQNKKRIKELLEGER